MSPANLALLIAELRRDEGVEYSTYSDSVGVPTIGVGHNLKVSPLPNGWEEPITEEEVNQLLQEDLTIVFNELNSQLHWWSSLDDVRQRVIANMCFQLGINGLLEFKHMLAALHIADYGVAAIQMKNSLWFTQSGQRSVRLCQAMATGIMPDDPKV